MSRDSRLISLALKLTYQSLHKQPTGAVLALGGHPVSLGINKAWVTHPKQDHTYQEGQKASSTHAELSAIIGIPRETLSRCTLYIARRRRGDNSPGLAAPCKICRRIIREAGIKKVVYTTSGNRLENWRVEER